MEIDIGSKSKCLSWLWMTSNRSGLTHEIVSKLHHFSLLGSCKSCEKFINIKNIRTPTGFGANLYNVFTGNDKVSGLKSHDFYNILRFHIPIVIRGLTTSSVREANYRLSWLVRWMSRTSPKGMSETQWAQGGSRSDTWNLWRRWWEGPSDPSMGEGPGR
jgi:hypothetical protein